MAQCNQCKLKPDCHRDWKTSGDQATNCVSFTPKKTNADKIRAMTDEELSEAFETLQENASFSGAHSSKYWLDWLKEEAHDEKDFD